MRDQRPVIRKSVHFIYRGDEIVNLVRAAYQLPPFRLELGLSELRIEYYSMVSRDWLCGFNFSRAPGTNNWTLEQVEYDLGTTLKRALAQLGELEEKGLKRLKYGM
ncbi:MAG TPA: hypothetical protein VFD58_31330 [Blastocatellia bacterium]|nr:hypothetical protein [Blastocatellia bacterium]